MFLEEKNWPLSSLILFLQSSHWLSCICSNVDIGHKFCAIGFQLNQPLQINEDICLSVIGHICREEMEFISISITPPPPPKKKQSWIVRAALLGGSGGGEGVTIHKVSSLHKYTSIISTESYSIIHLCSLCFVCDGSTCQLSFTKVSQVKDFRDYLHTS